MDTPPLPPYQLRFRTSQFYPLDQSLTWEGFVFTWGDLKITSAKAAFDPKSRTLRATGGVVVERGDERISAELLEIQGLDLLSGKRDLSQLSLSVKQAQLSSPPFFLAGETIAFRSATGGEGQHLRFVPGTEGKAELVLFAEKVTAFPGSNRLTFRNATLRLYGVRLLTLTRLTLNPSSTTKRQGLSLTLPLTFRTSRLSGATLGLRLPFSPVRGMRATTLVESSSRQGVGTLFTLQRELLKQGPSEDQDSLLTALGSTQVDETERIRTLLTARVPPAYPLAEIGWQDLLATVPIVVRAETGTLPRLRVEGILQNNREFVRRNAQLLLGSQPEVRLLGRLPQHRGDGGLIAEVGVGRFVETRFDQGRVGYREDRLQTRFGWEAPTVHFGSAGRLRLNLTSTQQNYRASVYRFQEARLAGDYGFSQHTGVSAGVILREVSGSSPFLFDTLEAQNEGQLRGQTALGPYLLGAVGRWDLTARKLFDSEISLSLRGKTIEPRVSWRSQNQQFSFSVVFPALTGS